METTLKVHPFAEKFPMMADDDLTELTADIKANGLLHPILVDADGQLLDGRNRLAACKRLKIEPAVAVHEGDPIALIISANVSRRQLSAGQVAMARAIALVEAGKRQNGRWKRGTTVENSIVRKDYLAWAGVVLDETPNVAADVLAKNMSLDEAYRDAVKIRNDRNSDATHLDELRAEAPDLAVLVDEGAKLSEQYAALEQRRKDRADQIRDARGLLERILTLTAPVIDADRVPAFVADWVETIGSEYVTEARKQQLDIAIDTLVLLRKAYL